jgi:hypothetical protein
MFAETLRHVWGLLFRPLSPRDGLSPATLDAAEKRLGQFDREFGLTLSRF